MEQARDGFVLDCSVTMAWCFDDEAAPYTDGVQDQLDAESCSESCRGDALWRSLIHSSAEEEG